ncbi:MAG TPA: hypothetical protein VHY56_03170, partial [Candidatus Binataceae bacterium]|nr:hypothetical protein [Candidatus Binataceae bacterium]
MVPVAIVKVLPQFAQLAYVAHQDVVSPVAHPVVVDHVLHISDSLIQFAFIEIAALMQPFS